ncbi:inositol-tetrakisphosphate 1-kinase [Hydra vulgaris]|uniref:Inositol-tetrakisphosphate 1-kinase n=1 Tax=Hydra vulgaris TaxID=6087 RepID=A0ABM4CD60_HYDVU
MTPLLRVGLCIPTRKKLSMCLPEKISDLCKASNIELCEINPSIDLETQGPFDVVLHKVLDYHNELSTEEANKKIKSFVTYFANHQDTILIDNLEWCTKFTNRKYMIELLKSCEFSMKGKKVFLPKTIHIVDKMTISDILHIISEQKVRFPVILKPYSAYFDNGSHDMALIFSSDSLLNVEPPYLIQEFHNHNGVIYKVFVVGNNFNICERPSIKNFKVLHEIESPLKEAMHFDSHCISKTGQPYFKELQSEDPNKKVWCNDDTNPNLLNRSIIKELILRIQTKTNLFLFGFDILVDNENGDYAVIDINQFPSYAGIGEHHFANHLVDLFKSFIR